MPHVIKDWDKLLNALKAQGWLLEKTMNGHFKALDPTGEHLVVLSGSGEPRAHANALADLRRRGFRWPALPKEGRPLPLEICPTCKKRSWNAYQGICMLSEHHTEPLREIDLGEVSRLRAAGLSFKKIEERLGVDQNKIRRELVKAGAHAPARHPDKAENQQLLQQVATLHREGRSLRDIAKTLSISFGKVHRLWKQAEGQPVESVATQPKQREVKSDVAKQKERWLLHLAVSLDSPFQTVAFAKKAYGGGGRKTSAAAATLTNLSQRGLLNRIGDKRDKHPLWEVTQQGALLAESFDGEAPKMEMRSCLPAQKELRLMQSILSQLQALDKDARKRVLDWVTGVLK